MAISGCSMEKGPPLDGFDSNAHLGLTIIDGQPAFVTRPCFDGLPVSVTFQADPHDVAWQLEKNTSVPYHDRSRDPGVAIVIPGGPEVYGLHATALKAATEGRCLI